MGSRANYVVIEQGEQHLAWTRWGAQSVVADLLAGPEASTLAFRPPVPPVPPAPNTADALRWTGVTPVEQLMTEIYCEGAALIDHDRRVLLAFQWVEDYATFVDGLAALSEAWPGWHVRWAFDGILDVARHLGMDPAPLREQIDLSDAALFSGPDDWRPALPDNSDVGVLSVRHPDGSLAMYLTTDDSTLVACATAAGIEALPPGFATLDRPTMPRWGLHLDRGARTAGVWTVDRLSGALIDPSAAWPGWTWTLWGGDIRRQLVACAGALQVPPLPANLRDMHVVGV
jgi:hypothetical protein